MSQAGSKAGEAMPQAQGPGASLLKHSCPNQNPGPPHALGLPAVQITQPLPEPGSQDPHQCSLLLVKKVFQCRVFLQCSCHMHSFIRRLLFEHLHWARQWGQWQLDTCVSRVLPSFQGLSHHIGSHPLCSQIPQTIWGTCFCFSVVQ